MQRFVTQYKIRFSPAFSSSDCSEGICFRILSFHYRICSTKRSLHNTSGDTEDHSGTGTFSQRRIKRLLF